MAHEWFHAFDHYLARLDGKVPSTKETNDRGDTVYKKFGGGRDFVRGRGPSEVGVVTVSCQLMRASVMDLVLIVLICLVALGLCVW